MEGVAGTDSILPKVRMRPNPRPVSSRPILMRALACLPLVLPLLGLFPATASARTGYPKVVNIYLSNSVTPEELQELSKWDVLVLDTDFPYDNPGAIDQLRAINPEIVILGSIPINGTWTAGYQQPVGTVAYKYWEGIAAGDFWLYDATGGVVNDWPGKGSTNLTPNCPVNAQGQAYWEWFAHFVDDTIWKHGQSEWDGIFLDDVWDNISWLNSGLPYSIDSDRDGTADVSAELDAWWTATNDSCTALVRELLGPDAVIASNGANSCYRSLNGTMAENFPFNGRPDQDNIYGYAWMRWTLLDRGSYFRGLENYVSSPMQLSIINSFAAVIGDQPDTTGRFQAHKRLGLGTALLGDGYYSLDNLNHSMTWWQPEYDIYLGAPIGPAYTYIVGGLSIWRRDYTEASVIVNPNNAALIAQAGLPTIDGWDAYIGPRIMEPVPPDTSAPAEVDDYWGGKAIDSHSVFFRWQAVGDDGKTGRATSYQIRYREGMGNATYEGPTWDAATEIPNSIVPGWAGFTESITVGGLDPDTYYYFAVRATDDVGHIGPLQVYHYRIKTLLTDPPLYDTIPPAAITTLEAVSIDSTGTALRWTAPGDDGTDGTAAIYRGRISDVPIDAANWDSALPIFWLPTPLLAGTVQTGEVRNLVPGTTYYVALRAEDEVPNLGPIGNVLSFTTLSGWVPPPPPPADTTGPSVITDLLVIDRAETTFTLRFTAPTAASGVVAGYDLRRVSGDVFTLAQWDTALTIPTGQPASPGMHEMVQVEGLNPGTSYAFRVRAHDDADNWSDLSAAVSATTLEPTPPPPPIDVTPPAAVADLVAAVTDTFKITLTWIAPGDDGTGGQADRYDLRYRLGGLDASTWASATTVEDAPSPAPAGAPQTFAIMGLPPDTTIAFALVTVDDANNASPMSNVATARIASPPPPPPPPDTQPPGAVEDFDRGIEMPGIVALSWTAAPEPDVAFYRIYRSRSGAIALTLYRDGVQECAWEDRQVVPGREYVYAVTAVDGAGNEGPRSTLVHVRVPVNVRPELPEGVFALGEPSPNPSSGPMSLQVETGSSLTVSVEVFDLSGRLVCGPRFDTLGRGAGTIAWDGRDASGLRVSRGMYFVRVRGNATSELRRVWVLP